MTSAKKKPTSPTKLSECYIFCAQTSLSDDERATKAELTKKVTEASKKTQAPCAVTDTQSIENHKSHQEMLQKFAKANPAGLFVIIPKSGTYKTYVKNTLSKHSVTQYTEVTLDVAIKHLEDTKKPVKPPKKSEAEKLKDGQLQGDQTQPDTQDDGSGGILDVPSEDDDDDDATPPPKDTAAEKRQNDRTNRESMYRLQKVHEAPDGRITPVGDSQHCVYYEEMKDASNNPEVFSDFISDSSIFQAQDAMGKKQNTVFLVKKLDKTLKDFKPHPTSIVITEDTLDRCGQKYDDLIKKLQKQKEEAIKKAEKEEEGGTTTGVTDQQKLASQWLGKPWTSFGEALWKLKLNNQCLELARRMRIPKGHRLAELFPKFEKCKYHDIVRRLCDEHLNSYTLELEIIYEVAAANPDTYLYLNNFKVADRPMAREGARALQQVRYLIHCTETNVVNPNAPTVSAQTFEARAKNILTQSFLHETKTQAAVHKESTDSLWKSEDTKPTNNGSKDKPVKSLPEKTDDEIYAFCFCEKCKQAAPSFKAWKANSHKANECDKIDHNDATAVAAHKKESVKAWRDYQAEKLKNSRGKRDR